MTGHRLDDEDDKKNPADGRNAPEVIEKALFEARVVMLTGEVNDIQARRVTERLFALASQNSKPITFVISSPGGHVESTSLPTMGEKPASSRRSKARPIESHSTSGIERWSPYASL